MFREYSAAVPTTMAAQKTTIHALCAMALFCCYRATCTPARATVMTSDYRPTVRLFPGAQNRAAQYELMPGISSVVGTCLYSSHMRKAFIAKQVMQCLSLTLRWLHVLGLAKKSLVEQHWVSVHTWWIVVAISSCMQ